MATNTDPLDMTIRALLQQLLASREPGDTGWVNVRTDELPWRHLVAAAERGEVQLSRVGRKLMMRRSELDSWLDSQQLKKHRPQEAKAPAGEVDAASLLAAAGFKKRQRG